MKKLLIFIIAIGCFIGYAYAQSAKDIQTQLMYANNIIQQQNAIIVSAQKDIDADNAQIQDRQGKITIANGIIQTTQYQINYWSSYLDALNNATQDNSQGINWTDSSIINVD